MTEYKQAVPSCGCEKYLKPANVVGEGIASASQCEICKTVYAGVGERWRARIKSDTAMLLGTIEAESESITTMKEFYPEKSGAKITEAIHGKTVERVDVDSVRMDDFLLFRFTDGTTLRIQYDYLYAWGLEEAPVDNQ